MHPSFVTPAPHTDGEGWGIARLKYGAITLLLSRHAVQGINDGILILRSLPQGYFLLYLHFSKTFLDEPLDVHLCSYFHEQHCVTRRDVIQT